MKDTFVFETDLPAKTIHIAREFNAPLEKVWRAWTEADLIDKWIGPKPWKAETKIMDFTVGGIWLYAMVGTAGEKHWTRIEFTAIETGKSVSSDGMFCDEDGNAPPGGPKSHRVVTFSALEGNRTKVESVITFTDESIIKMFVEGGFKIGTITGFAQLDELLAE